MYNILNCNNPSKKSVTGVYNISWNDYTIKGKTILLYLFGGAGIMLMLIFQFFFMVIIGILGLCGWFTYKYIIEPQKEQEKQKNLEEEREEKGISCIEQYLKERYGNEIGWEPVDDRNLEELNNRKTSKVLIIKVYLNDTDIDILKLELIYNTKYTIKNSISDTAQKKEYEELIQNIKPFKNKISALSEKINAFADNAINRAEPLTNTDNYPAYKEKFKAHILTNGEACEEMDKIHPCDSYSVVSKDDFKLNGITEGNMIYVQERIDQVRSLLSKCYESSFEAIAETDKTLFLMDYVKDRARDYIVPGIANTEEIEIIKTVSEKLQTIWLMIWGDTAIIKDAYSQYRAIKIGSIGEIRTKDAINSFIPSEWMYFQGIVLPIVNPQSEKERSVGEYESDFIIISDTIIYVLEVKNYSSGTLNISKDGRVQHFSRSNQKMEENRSVIQQCEEHVIYTARLLSKETGQDYTRKVKGIIVVANEDIEINNESDYSIIRLSLLRNKLFKETGIRDKLDIQKLSAIIEKDIKEPHKYPFCNHEIQIKYDDCKILLPLLDKVDKTMEEYSSYFKPYI